MLEVHVDKAAIEKELARLEKTCGDLRPLLTAIGEDLVASTKARFQSITGPDGVRWAPNSPVTIARKGAGKKPLTGETLQLQSQIHWQVTGNTLEVGSSMEYAGTMQFGAAKGAYGKTRRGAPIPWGPIPARPFIGISADDREDIEQRIRTFIDL